MTTRVVLTACGLVLPAGRTFAEVSATFAQNRNLFEHSACDPEVSICPVQGFDLKSYTGRFKNARYLNRGQQLTLAASLDAIRQSDLEHDELEQCGLFVGTGPNLEATPSADKALWLLDFLPNTLTSTIAQATGIRGENSTVVTACAASTQALGQAFLAVRNGLCSIALAGGGDSRLSEPAIRAYKNAAVLATGPAVSASRPFDANRSGFAIGEGAAMFLLETLEHARARKAVILGEILGCGSSLDGLGMTKPDPDGTMAMRAVEKTLSGSTAEMIIAHGTGTLQNDAMEAQLIRRIHGTTPKVAAFKSWIGHLAAGCGAAELALALACCQSGHFPPIRNLDHPCAPDLALLRSPYHGRPQSLIVHSFGFGGQNAALLIKPC